jgi:hypothetical protein
MSLITQLALSTLTSPQIPRRRHHRVADHHRLRPRGNLDQCSARRIREIVVAVHAMINTVLSARAGSPLQTRELQR